ncbi:MAG: PAS domain S-box protein [Chloroflexota bacterium]
MNRRPSMVRTAAFSLLSVLIILSGGIWFIRAQQQSLRREAETNLAIIARLKTDQIAAWRSERLADAAVFMEGPFLVENLTGWLENPDPELTEKILVRFHSLQEHYGYADVLLVDTAGQVRLSLTGRDTNLQPQAVESLGVALGSATPQLTDLHSDDDGDIHLDVIAPFYDPRDGTPVGAVVLQSCADDHLYPLIQSWPAESETAEFLLVRRAGDEALFLNELRHQTNTALRLHIPLSQTDSPAVMAVLGTVGVVQGPDYRGVEVLAVIGPVPDSPWYLVAKVDMDEAMAVWRTRSVLIVGLMFGFTVVAVALAGGFWQRAEKAHFKALFQAEAARRASEARFGVTLMSIGDAVIATDAKGRVELFNPVAEALTGWKGADATGRPLEEVFQIVNEQTRQSAENPVKKVLREGLVVGLANHSLLITRGGHETPIADSGAPIHDDAGKIIGVVLVFRDQSAERAAQKALLESEAHFRLLYEQSPVPYHSLNSDGRILEVNDAWLAKLGYTKDEVIGQPMADFLTPESKELLIVRFPAFIDSGSTHGGEFDMLSRDGNVISFEVEGRISTDSRGTFQRAHCILHDITERQRVEERIRRLNSELESLVEERTRELRLAQEQLVQEERLAVLGRLAAGIGHELRNPLGVISNAVFYLRGILPQTDPKVNEYFSIIEDESQIAEKIIRGLLDFSHPLQPDRGPVSVPELVERSLGVSPPPADIQVRLHLPARLPPVHVDHRQIEQALGNLLINAYQAMPQGGRLTIRAEKATLDSPQNPAQPAIALHIIDTGTGVLPEFIDQLFEPLFSTKARGIGLGLPIARKLAQANGGRIDARSTPGEGSSFTIYLPCHLPAQP